MRRSFGRTAAMLGTSAALIGAVALSGSTAANAAPSDSYVALGDSYAAGPVITPQDPTIPGCARSLANYPHLVAKKKRYALRDVTCSGAKTDDMFAAQSTGAGTNPPQLQALRKGTDVVTLTIGGNDIGFTGIIQDCLAATPAGPTASGAQTCKAFYTAGGTDQLAARIRATRPKVNHVLRAIHRRSPNAKVFLAGYPAILPESDPGPLCFAQMPLTTTDVAYLRGVEKQLNRMLANSAAADNATYVNTYTPTIGHDTCTQPPVRYIEPVVAPIEAAPVHPNRFGEAAMARIVARRIG
jgi:lysophospholipase L1-like esterase